MPHRFGGDPKEVSARMKLIRGKNTKPELRLFEVLGASGLPFTPHAKVEGITVDALVDGVVALFVDSPFWHLRDRTELDRLNPYWRSRLLRNWRRDRRQDRLLRSKGFTVVRVWTDDLDPRKVTKRVKAARTRALRRARSAF